VTLVVGAFALGLLILIIVFFVIINLLRNVIVNLDDLTGLIEV